MTMYGLVFGGEAAQQRGAVLLGMLGFAKLSDVGRYRDAWVERDTDGSALIAVYTRNGGGNRRECWEETESPDCHCPACTANIVLPAHPLWVRGADDEFDSTYRTEYFRCPEEHREVLAEVAGDHVDTSQRWLDAIDAIGKKP